VRKGKKEMKRKMENTEDKNKADPQ